MKDFQLLLLSIAVAVSVYLGYREFRKLHTRVDEVNGRMQEFVEKTQTSQCFPSYAAQRCHTPYSPENVQVPSYGTHPGHPEPSRPTPVQSTQPSYPKEMQSDDILNEEEIGGDIRSQILQLQTLDTVELNHEDMLDLQSESTSCSVEVNFKGGVNKHEDADDVSESVEAQEVQEVQEVQESQEVQDPQEVQESQDPQESQEALKVQESQDALKVQESQDPQEAQEAQEAQEVQDPQEVLEAQEAQEAQVVETPVEEVEVDDGSDAEEESMSYEDFERLTVKDLRRIAKDENLSMQGVKDDLIYRIMDKRSTSEIVAPSYS